MVQNRFCFALDIIQEMQTKPARVITPWLNFLAMNDKNHGKSNKNFEFLI